MKKGISILLIIILSICIICIICVGLVLSSSNKKDDKDIEDMVDNAIKEDSGLNISLNEIPERNYKKIGNNLYYEDKLIEYKGREDKEKILNCYKIISDYMQNAFPNIDFYIFNFNYFDLDGTMYFNAYQMINMVVFEDINFTLAVRSNKISEDIFFGSNKFINNTTIDTTNIISVNSAKRKALDVANENPNAFRILPIQGECYLMYDKDYTLCYKVVINYSYVKINANTGKIVDTYFNDGFYD